MFTQKLKEINMKVGDKFMYKSKYGGVVKDTIRGFTESMIIDAVNGAITFKWGIYSSSGIHYLIDEIIICERFLTKEECGNTIENIKNLLEAKEKRMRDKFK